MFRVEEYYVDAQKFTPPNTKNPGLENKFQEIVKNIIISIQDKI